MKNRASNGVSVGVNASRSMSARTSPETYADTSGRGPVTTRPPSGDRATDDRRVVGGDARRRGASSVVLTRCPGSGAMVRSSAMVPWKATDAAAHDRDVVADLLDLVHVVGAEQHRQAAAREPLHQGPHVAHPRRVEPVGRLVEDQQPRLAQQAGGDAEPLPHAVGVAADLVAGPLDEVDDVEHLVQETRARTAVEEGQPLEVLPAGQVGIELRALDEARHPVQDPDAVLGPGPAEHLDRAGVGPDQPEEHPQQRRLAGAVGSEHAVHLAGATRTVMSSTALMDPNVLLTPTASTASSWFMPGR